MKAFVVLSSVGAVLGALGCLVALLTGDYLMAIWAGTSGLWALAVRNYETGKWTV